MFRFLKLLCAVIVFTFLSFTVTAFAQATNASGEPVQAQQADNALPDPSSWTGILDSISQAIEREGVLNSEFDGFLQDAEAIRKSATDEIERLEINAEQLKAQIDELGPKPEDETIVEAAEITQRRDDLTAQFASVDAKLREARVALLRTRQIQTSITNQRKQRFFNKIELQTENLFTVEFWSRFFNGFNGFGRRLNILISDSFDVMVTRLSENVSVQLLLILSLIILTLGFVKTGSILNQFAVYEGNTENGELKSRFIRFCRYGVLPAILPYLFYKLFEGFDLFTARLDELILTIVIASGFTILALSLSHILLKKKDDRDRLLTVSDHAAAKINRIVHIGLFSALFLSIINAISAAIVAPLEVAVGLSVAFSIVVAATFILLLWTLHKDRILRSDEQKEMRFWRVLKLVSWTISFVILGTTFYGYVALGEFLSQQLLFGLLVIGSVWLLLRFVNRSFQPLIEAVAQPDDAYGSLAETDTSKQTLILSNGLINLGIYTAAGVLLMLPWGYRTSDFYQIFSDLFFGFEIGGLRISLATVLFALILFAIGYTITIALRSWLNNRYLPTTGLDIGVSNSISTVLGYVGFVIAAVLAISAAGFDLSSLAIVAGALSLGIGFGLQSIVSNFVSGLILLAERPIKAGDWVVTTGGEGTVTKISVRSTEIETFERATIIVPNSTLITDPVTNWTHENKLGRISVAIGVGYDSDPEEVKEILLNCVKENPRILGIPQPTVFFMDFGASSLDFQVRGFLSDINYCLSVQSELRFAILKALRDANIEIPFPQRDVHIRSGEAN